MQRQAIPAETAGRRSICIGQSLRPESSRAIHRPRNGTSRVIIRRLNTMSPDIIRLRHTVTRADHTRVPAQDRAAAAADTHRTAAVVAHIRMAAPEVDHRPTVAVLHPIVVAEGMNHTRVPVRTVSGGAEYCPLIGVDKNRKSGGQPTVALSAFSRMERTVYQTPLSLPVILNATAAAEASGGSKLRRKVAGTLPLKAAWVICLV